MTSANVIFQQISNLRTPPPPPPPKKKTFFHLRIYFLGLSKLYLCYVSFISVVSLTTLYVLAGSIHARSLGVEGTAVYYLRRPLEIRYISLCSWFRSDKIRTFVSRFKPRLWKGNITNKLVRTYYRIFSWYYHFLN